MGWARSRREHREEAGGTKGPCAGQPAGKRQRHRQESISRGCTGVDAWGVLKGHRVTPPGPGQGSCPKSVLCLPTHPPKEKPAKAQTASRVASSRVTRQTKPSRTLQEPDFTAETQRAPFQPELLTLSTKQRVMQKDLRGQGSAGWAGSLTAASLSSRGPWCIIPRRQTHGGFCDRREPVGKRETLKRPSSSLSPQHPSSVQTHQGL